EVGLWTYLLSGKRRRNLQLERSMWNRISFACSPRDRIVVLVEPGPSQEMSGWKIGEDGDWTRIWTQKTVSGNQPFFLTKGEMVCQMTYQGRDSAIVDQQAISCFDPNTGKFLEILPFASGTGNPTISSDLRHVAGFYGKEITVRLRNPGGKRTITIPSS